jgi:UDP-glucuronate 4-epimerase
LDFVEEIEKETGLTAQKIFMPMQDGDVAETSADIDDLKNLLNYEPSVSVRKGVKNFVNWFTTFYHPNLQLEPKTTVIAI